MNGRAAPQMCSRNPGTGEIIWEGIASTEDEVDQAVQRARELFPLWAQLPIEERIHFLEIYAQVLENSKEEFSEIISLETGKPRWETKAEVAAMISKIPISIDAYKNRCPEITQNQSTGKVVTRHKPHGVVAVLGPFNFPGHLPNGHIIPALLAGNTVVFKPSELTPLVGESMFHFWEASSLPYGVLNLVQGGPQVGKALVEHPEVDGLYFTGSAQTGQSFAEYYGKHPEKILALEMGGNNPLVVSQVSDIHAAAYVTIQSAYLTSGQRCSCARRLIVLEDKTAFMHELTHMIRRIKVGLYTDVPEPFMGPLINEKAVKKVLDAQAALESKGANILLHARVLKEGSCLMTPGLIDVTSVEGLPDEEIFGPLLQVIRVKDFDAAIEEANKTAYGLSAGLLSDDPDEFERFYWEVKAGIINWNTQLTGASSHAPFGGVGKSGNYRPSAFYAADYTAYPVASMECGTLALPQTFTPGIQVQGDKE